MNRKIRPWLTWLLVTSCTNADVYTVSGADPYRPDRIAVTGRICTEDTAGPKFPVKVLIMVENTLQMANADPDYYRFCGPGSNCAPGSIGALTNRTRNQPNAYLGFVGVSTVAKPIVPVAPALCVPPPCDPQQFFLAQDVEWELVQAELAVPSGQDRDVSNAISQAESFITADMAQASAGEILRSRYLIYMLFAGPPTGSPHPDPAELAEDVQRLRDFVYSRGALEFRLNTGLLFFGDESWQTGPGNYSCHTVAGSQTCVCGGQCADTTHSAGYCDACCRAEQGPPLGWSGWNDWNQDARDAYSAMAFAGDGLFREFQCPATIDFRLDSATTSIHLMRKDIVAYNANVRLAYDGPTLDSDADGLTDSEEAAAVPPTSAIHWDTDGDSLNDRLEFRCAPQQDPTDPTDLPKACDDPAVWGLIPDLDADLLNDCEEGLLQTDATIPDTDGDGLPDALEFMGGTGPTSATDRLLDYDGDGISNAQEVLEHTNPRTNDGYLRGAEGYRSTIVDLGRRMVATMEDRVELRAVTFRSASPNVQGGPALLRWDPVNRTLAWSDNRWQVPQYRFDPVPVPIDFDDGVHSPVMTLTAKNNTTGEVISIEVSVVEPWLPDEPVEIYPLISTSERNCYDVQISNIKLMQTLAAEDILHVGSQHDVGTNHILIFFTQAPEDRLESPGISKVAEIPVTFRCTDPDVIDSCARTPSSGFIEITDADFTSAVP